MTAHKSGFVAIIGPTNSGKSTLLNQLMGEKLSIVSKRPQTTYHGIRGILTKKDYQVIFTDTPGLQRFSESFPRLLNKVADRNAADADLVMWVFDATVEPLVQIEKLKERIQATRPREKSLVVLNKVDRVAKPDILPLIEAIWKLELFAEIIPLSALKGDNTDAVLKCVLPRLPEGPALYDGKSITDRSFDFRVAEMIREKVYHLTHQEIPYSVRVEMEHWDAQAPAPKGKTPILNAVIHVDSSSRKKILIGRGGEMLKKVGIASRRDIEKLLGRQVCLKLHVDVEEDWRSNPLSVNNYLELN